MAIYKKITTKDNEPIQVDSAIQDGLGRNIANTYVKNTGTEDIGGAKTFTSPVYSNVHDVSFVGKQGIVGFRAYKPNTTDNAGQMLITSDDTVDGSYRLSIQAYNKTKSTVAGSNVYNTFRIGDTEGLLYKIGSTILFKVNDSGTVTVTTNPVNDLDLATKQYVDNELATKSNATNLKNGNGANTLEHSYSYANKNGAVGLNGAIAKGTRSLAVGASKTGNHLAVAEGEYAEANGWASHAAGYQTRASYPYQFVCGLVNEDDEDSLFEVGNGEAEYEEILPRPSYAEAVANRYYLLGEGDGDYRLVHPNLITEASYNNDFSKTFRAVLTQRSAFKVMRDGTAHISVSGTEPTSVVNYEQMQAATSGKSTATNLENGIGTNAIREKMADATVNFTGRNPKAEALDPTISTTINTGASGNQSSAFGKNTMALATASFTNGNKTLAKGEESHAEGYQSVTLGGGSHAEGNQTVSAGDSSHSEGYQTQATGNYSHSEGTLSSATAEGAHAEGYNTTASASHAHSEGNITEASGSYSHSEGQDTHASGYASHAQGAATYAKGTCSFTGGQGTEANANFATAIGLGLYTGVEASFVVGKYNATTAGILFGVGNGTSASARSNVFEIYQDGHATVGGKTIATTDDIPNNNILENGTGTNAVRQKMADATVNFAGRNPNAEAIDPTISTTINTGASGNQSTAFGKNTMALATASFTNGNKTVAKGEESHAEGYQSVTLGDGSHAEGSRTTAYGAQSHSEGIETIAYGNNSHAEGEGTQARGINSHSEGYYSQALGNASHAEGSNTVVNAITSHAEGVSNYIGAQQSDNPSSGSDTSSTQPSGYTPSKGEGSHAEGYDNFVYGIGSHAEGAQNVVSGDFAHAEGLQTTASNTASHSEGYRTKATGLHSHAEGENTEASGVGSHAEGDGSQANGLNSFAGGHRGKANGSNSFAFNGTASGENSMAFNGTASNDNAVSLGYKSSATGQHSFTANSYNTAGGNNSVALGNECNVSGNLSFAIGYGNTVSGTCSMALGRKLSTSGNFQAVVGQFNAENSNARFIVGNGTDEKSKSNAFEVYQDGTLGIPNFDSNGNKIGMKKIKCVNGVLTIID